MSDFVKLDDNIKLPTWALCPLFNADYSGINDEQEKEFDEWYAEMVEKHGQITINIQDETSNFEPYPAFGLADNCVVAAIWGYHKQFSS